MVTGVSGSGKSSLALDTIFAEGQRQYIESLSVYARQFLHQMERPDVDLIEGLQPTISIDQRRQRESAQHRRHGDGNLRLSAAAHVAIRNSLLLPVRHADPSAISRRNSNGTAAVAGRHQNHDSRSHGAQAEKGSTKMSLKRFAKPAFSGLGSMAKC